MFLENKCFYGTLGAVRTKLKGNAPVLPISPAKKPDRINFSPAPEEDEVIQALISDAGALGFPMTRMQALRWLVKAGMKSYTDKKAMEEPLVVKKLKFPAAALQAMSVDRGTALLLLGLVVNETNWLYKLLVMAVQALPDSPDNHPHDPEEQANLALTGVLATTLVGKVYEGWVCMGTGKLRATLDELLMPDELKNRKAQLSERLSGKLFLRIRQQAFHYSEKDFNFSKFKDRFGDQDTHIYVTAAGYRGDMLSRVSAIARLDALSDLAHLLPADSDEAAARNVGRLVAYKRVLDEVVQVTGLYCNFVTDTLATLMKEAFTGKLSSDAFTITDAPAIQAEQVHFFLHPPRDLTNWKTN
jgi:hypothetical protein